MPVRQPQIMQPYMVQVVINLNMVSEKIWPMSHDIIDGSLIM